MDDADLVLLEPLGWGDPVTTDGSFLLPVGTVTMLLADVAGSTRRWEEDESGMAEATATHAAVIDAEVARHHGVRPLEQGEGDSFVAAFARPSDAVACALAIAVTAPLSVRMAVHTGEAHRTDEGTYVGPTLNRAGRLRDAAHGGQIVLSHASAEIVADRLPKEASLRDLGRHRLKDLERPELIFQLLHPDLRSTFPPLRTLDTYRQNLPQLRTPLFGRRRELEDLASLVATSRLVTVTGPGGCGKTRVALALAAKLLDDYDDGVYFADLSPVPVGGGADAVREAIGRALGLTDEAASEPALFLRDKAAVVVVDNCEHVIRSAAEVVDALLASCVSLRVLATSREPIGLEGEATCLLSPLPVPPPEAEGIAGLAAYAAAELFVDRARRSRSDFEPTDSDAHAIAEICRRLDGIPLAIELAAARIRVMSPGEIADGLHQRFDLLTGGARTALPRQQTLRASVDWSHELLTEPEQIVFRRLAVFAAGFDLDATVAVCGENPIARHQVLDLLSLLVEKSLVVVDHGRDRSRYRLLDTIRRYALHHLTRAQEEHTTRQRHRDHYLERAEAAARAVPSAGGAAAFELFVHDLADSESSFRWSLERGDVAEAARYAANTAELYATIWIGAPLRVLEPVTSRLDETETTTQRALLYAHARHLLKTEVPATDEFRAMAARAVTDLDQLTGEEWTKAVVVANTFGITAGDDAIDRALAGVDTALANGAIDTAVCAQISAWRLARSAARPDALALAARVGELAAQGGPLLHASVLTAYGAYLHDPSAALAVAEHVLSHELVQVPSVHRHLQRDAAFALEALSRHTEAAVYAEDVEPRFRENGDLNCAGWMLNTLSYRAEERGELDEALDLVRRAADDVRPTPLWRGFSPILLARSAALHLALGDLGQALAAHSEYASVPPEHQGPFHPIFTSLVEALIAVAEHRSDASERAHDALDDAVRSGAIVLPTALALVAVADAQRGRDPEATIRLLAASRELKGAGTRAPWPIVDRMVDDAARELETSLDAGDVRRLRDDGRRLSRDDATAYARRGRGERRRPTSGWSSLTPAEAQVVSLVAEGLTNAMIAQRLFVSVRTVTTHLTHVYTKLGLSSRSELAVAAMRRNIGAQ